MRIFLVTNEASTSAFECQRLMRWVNEFCMTTGEGWIVVIGNLVTGPGLVSE
jgi:hypothetical protein